MTEPRSDQPLRFRAPPEPGDGRPPSRIDLVAAALVFAVIALWTALGSTHPSATQPKASEQTASTSAAGPSLR
ncbi:hypothetical protein SLNSH_18325 [Alsobacter soli]|uniref:Uncharacterized protein n=1 Tax=Alsobacter soli TaxID=2109933 RepID=A0A2T1HPL9_9HYPH|nr:hypothetical protein SLNSH_18325 [Alsobacter soli]